MTHFDYLISRPGRPVHLAVYAYRDVGDELVAGTGHYVPLCGQDRGARWQLTGTWAEKWPRHVKAGLCDRCRRRAFQLIDGAFAVLVPGNDFAVSIPAIDGTNPLFEAIEVAS